MTSVELQIVQLRDEMREEFSAVRSNAEHLGTTLRGEMAQMGVTLRAEMEQFGVTLRAEMEQFGATLRVEMAQLGTTLRGEMADLASTLRDEIRGGDEETRRYMRVLHEDLVDRISLLQEGIGRKRKRRQ